MLPVQIGSKVRIPSHERDAKRYLDWAGFTLEEASLETFTMRRDFAPLRYPEPPRPASLADIRVT
jgi:hypothetical protein